MSETTMPTMDRDGYAAQVAILASIVGEYKEAKGTVSQRRSAATLEALAAEVTADDLEPFTAYSFTLGDTVTLGDIANSVQAFATLADGLRDSLVSAILKEQSQSADEVAALKERYDSQRNLVTSLATVLTAMGQDVADIEVPVLRSGGATGPRGPKAKGMTFYRIVDGITKPQSDKQDSLSSFAFYHGEKITGSKANGSHTNHLTTWLEANVDNNDGKFSLGKPWSVEVNGVTYGMDIVTADESETVEA